MPAEKGNPLLPIILREDSTKPIRSNANCRSQIVVHNIQNSTPSTPPIKVTRIGTSRARLFISDTRAHPRPNDQMAKGSPSYQYYQKHNRRARERAASATLRDTQWQQKQQEEREQQNRRLEQRTEEVSTSPTLSCHTLSGH
jgi:hypothetical protein